MSNDLALTSCIRCQRTIYLTGPRLKEFKENYKPEVVICRRCKNDKPWAMPESIKTTLLWIAYPFVLIGAGIFGLFASVIIVAVLINDNIIKNTWLRYYVRKIFRL